MTTLDRFAIHVVSHTHWDREWYLPLARMRQRLVALVDELLDAPPEEGSFLLDGQAIILEDYLGVRPEREAELRALLERGVLEAGPWYVLADELLPSGEALVRNLLEGMRTVRARGGAPPPVLYCPDSFGHPADLPLLAHGFGLPLIILWRGLGGPRWPEGDTFAWRTTSGGRALVHHLPPSGYEYGANLPTDEGQARERWRRLREMLAERARTNVLLVLNGADHHARQSKHHEALTLLAKVATPDRILRSSLRGFAEALVAHASEHRGLPEIAGELRTSYGYTWTVPGTWSSRSYQKRRNARIERLLTREAEPWAAIAAARGARPRGHLLQAAWRTLLKCHPHDTLCGCSADEVARDADVRFASAHVQARGVMEDAVHDLMGHDSVRARTNPGSWRPQLLLRNSASYLRRGVAEVEVMRFVADEPVGPGSGGVIIKERLLPGPALSEGRVPLQVLERTVRSHRVESPRHYPDNDRVDVARCVAWVDDVPGYGIVGYAISDATSASLAASSVDAVRATDRTLENGFVRVAIDPRGEARVEWPTLGIGIARLLRFDDVGDAGDLYTHSPLGPVIARASLVSVHLKHAGPLRGELLARYALEIPRSSSRSGRSSELVRQVIDVALILDAGSRVLRLRLRGVNRASDHRFRVVFSTGLRGTTTLADAMFGPVVREPSVQPPGTETLEHASPTAPLARWVARFGTSHGVAVVSDGLGEYEAMNDGSIAVTLIRAVGALSRSDLPERPGNAGWPTRTPAAQCRGSYRAEFGIVAHAPAQDEAIAEIEHAADEVLLPLRGTTLRSAIATPTTIAGLSLEGAGLRFLACKPSEDGRWTVLRCVNSTRRAATGVWQCGWEIREATRSRLDEQPGEAIPVRDARVDFTAQPGEVVTVLVR